MASAIENSPVKDTVPKVNSEIAVGEDPEFQRRWWKFETGVWILFVILVMLDLSGVLGRGPLAKARKATVDGMMDVSYERVERTGTPSALKVEFSNQAIQNGKIQLWVSESLITKLGNKQVAPQPAVSTVGDDGILYSFPATSHPATAVFSLQPAAPGLYSLRMKVAPSSELQFKILVMP